MPRAALRGRAADLTAASAALARVRRTGRGAVVLVTGDAGIGKSALLAALREEASSFRVSAAKAYASAGASPGQIVFDALRCGEPLLDATTAGELAPLVDRPLQLLEGVAAAIRRSRQGRPALVLVDDVQWADRLSRFVLRSLPGRLSDLPVAFVLSSRDPTIDVIRDLRSDAGPGVGVTHVELGPLASADLAAIAQDRLGRVPDATVRGMLDRLGGNPFLAVQLLDSVVAEGTAGVDGPAAPLEFAEGIRRTLSTLCAGAVGVLHLAAVLGRPLGYDEPRTVLGADVPAGTAAAADTAMRSGLVVGTRQTMRFRHDLIQEAVYAAVPTARRTALHRRCAEYLLEVHDDPVGAAGHLRVVARVGDTAAAEVLLTGAERAVAAQPDLAGELAREAFGLLAPTDPGRPATAERCTAILSAVQRFADVVAIADEIATTPDDPELGARVEAAAAEALFVMGRAPEAVARIDAVLARHQPSAAIRARLLSSRALASSRVAPSGDAQAAAASALALAREVGDRHALTTALAATCEVNKNGGYHARTLRAARELRLTAGASYLAQEIMALQLTDRYDVAQTMLDAAQADAANRVEAVLPSLTLAGMWQDFWLSRWAGAEHAAAELATIGRELGSHVHALEGMSILSVAALQRGDIALARARYERMLDYRDIDDEYRGPRMTLIHSWIVASEGDVHRAAALLRPLVRTALESRAHWPWWPGWMRTILHIGRSAGDPELVETADAVAAEGAVRNPGIVSFEGLHLQLQGLVTDDVDLLRAAVELLATGPREILAVTARKDLGHVLLAHGHVAEGLQQLRTASGGYARLEMPIAMAAISRAVARHGGVGASGTTDTAARWATLSAAERRVALLVGRGRSSRAAAAELHLSPNTIGSHTRTVFAKLGVNSRVQLANLLRQVEQAGVEHPE